ncbi:MAG TPA: hypothetical protein VHA07_12845 [Devosia sp.]|nr:hypothetical protein [Devosia sp.]
MSLTLGIALATLLVAGGIVAGPALVDCTGTPAGLGACLHAKAVDNGLLHETLPSAMPAPGRPAGWIEANATEYDAPGVSGAILSPKAGRIGAGGLAPSSGELTADVSISPDRGGLLAGGASFAPAPEARLSLMGPAGELRASLSLPQSPRPARVALGDQAGRIWAGRIGPSVAVDARVVLQGPSGELGAGASAESPSLPAAIALNEGTGSMAVGIPLGPSVATLPAWLAPGPGRVGASGDTPVPPSPRAADIAPGGGTLSAGGAAPAGNQPLVPAVPEPMIPPPPMPAPLPRDWSTLEAALPTDQPLEQIAVMPAAPSPELVVSPPVHAAPGRSNAAAPRSAALRAVPRYDPRFPNVIVLPPPDTGENSSFATLEVR